MKAAPFAYHRPRAVPEALRLLAELDDVKVLAGGQSLVPMMNFRLVGPANVLDINGVSGLARIETDNDTLTLGAMVRQRDAERAPEVRARCPLLVEALSHVGHVPTRNRGTIGGSLAHLDPAAELPVVLAAHDASLEVAHRGGSRTIAIADWTRDFLTPALEPGELLTSVKVPLWPTGHGYAFAEFARRHGDFAYVSAAVLMSLDAAGAIERVAVAVGGMAAGPVRLVPAEDLLAGETPQGDLLIRAACTAHDLPGMSDIHAGADYRRKLAAVYVRRALQTAWERARARPGR